MYLALKGFEASLPYDYTMVNMYVLRLSFFNEIPESRETPGTIISVLCELGSKVSQK